MALFNTLFLFPGVIPHGSVSEKPFGCLGLPLATYVRWYWRVRRWEMTLTVGTSSVSQEYEQSLDGFTPLAGETQLLPGTGRLAAVGDPVVTGDADGSQSNVNIGNILGRTCYDPSTQRYLWDEADGFLYLNLPDGSSQSVLFPDRVPGGQSVTVHLTMDGLHWDVEAYYSYVAGQDAPPTPPAPPACTCEIKPVRFWDWGGKYDPATGARL